MSAPTSITDSPCHSSYECRKRTKSNEDDNKNPKKVRWFYMLASESSSKSDDGTESVDSIQGKETDYVKDTTDTDTKSTLSVNTDLEVEFDVISSLEEGNMYSEGSSSGDDDALIAAGAVAATLCDEQKLDVWVTNGDHDTDSAISDFDFQPQANQKCRMCKIRPTVSCFPLCSYCHQARKTYFTPRPQKRKHKKTDKDKVPESSTSNTKDVSNSLTSDKTGSLIYKTKDMSTSSLTSDKTGSNEPVTGSSSLPSFDDSWRNWELATKEMCIMCNERPKNGMFLHNTGGHMCCCYKCAVKYWSKSKRCAYCNMKIKNVVKAFVV